MSLNNLHRMIQNPAEGLVTSPFIQFATTTAMLLFTPSRPCRIVRWGVVVGNTAPVAASTVTLKFTGDVFAAPGGTQTTGSTTSFGGASTSYNSSNSPVFYVDTAGGSLTVPVAAITAATQTVVAGSVLWHNVNPQVSQTGGYYPAPDTALISPGGVDTQLLIYPGQQFQVTCATVGTTTAGYGKIFLEVEEQGFVADYNNNQLVTTGVQPTAILPTPSSPLAWFAVNAQS